MTAVLYDFGISGNAWKVRTLLRALDLPFVIRWVDLIAGEQSSRAFAALNPARQVPVLQLDDGRVLRESSAILLTLGAGSALLPEAHRHTITEWLCFEQTWIDGIISRARFRRLHPDAVPTPEVFFDAWRKEGDRGLTILDRHLDGRAFVVDDTPTLADIALYAYTHCADDADHDLARFAHLRAWHARVAALDYVWPLNDNPEAET
jgi:glutathione S-transferase